MSDSLENYLSVTWILNSSAEQHTGVLSEVQAVEQLQIVTVQVCKSTNKGQIEKQWSDALDSFVSPYAEEEGFVCATNNEMVEVINHN